MKPSLSVKQGKKYAYTYSLILYNKISYMQTKFFFFDFEKKITQYSTYLVFYWKNDSEQFDVTGETTKIH